MIVKNSGALPRHIDGLRSCEKSGLGQIKKPESLRFRLCFGGERGIRTLETLLGFIRFPVVRARPGYAISPFVYKSIDYISVVLDNFNV